MFDPCWGLDLIGTDKTSALLTLSVSVADLSVRVADPFSPCC